MIHKVYVFHVNAWAYLHEKVEWSNQIAVPQCSIAMTHRAQMQVVKAVVWWQKDHMHMFPMGTWFSRTVNMLGKVLSTTKYNLHGGYILEKSDYIRSMQKTLLNFFVKWGRI